VLHVLIFVSVSSGLREPTWYETAKMLRAVCQRGGRPSLATKRLCDEMLKLLTVYAYRMYHTEN
jgi:hypothetical protein